MKQLITFIAILFSLLSQAQAPTLNQYGTRTPKLEPYPTSAKSIDVNSGLSVNSTTAGFVPPRMTTTQKLAISSPVAGTLVYDSTIGGYQLFNGTTWVAVGGSTSTVPSLQEVVDEGNSVIDNTISLSDSGTGSSSTLGYNSFTVDNIISGRSTYYSGNGIQTNQSGETVNINFPTPSGSGTINFPDAGSDTKTVAYVEDISAGSQDLQSVLDNGNEANGSIKVWEDAEHLGNVATIASDIISVGPASLQDSAGITTGALFFKSSQTGSPSVSLYSNTTTHSYTVDYPDKPEGSEQTAIFASDLAAYQPIDSDLTDIAALSPPNDNLLQRKAGAWTSRTPAQVKTDLALTKADVNLDNVDNTSDANKPISTAVASEYNAVSGAIFSGTIDLSKKGGTYYADYTQSGVINFAEGTTTVGGLAVLNITANGSAINLVGSWRNVGSETISTTNGAVNRIMWLRVNNETWYSVKVN